mmetsp:Transcript_26920/g.82867  ORF Transcript_26920/g.82867 Transcript_26920/m.82867 type:complete len:264 (-) Transcript_26920:647-1438(-)
MVSSRVVAMIFAQQTSAENARIAYGSCSKHHLAQPLWPAVRARRPRAWVWAGDIIYGDKLVSLLPPRFESLGLEFLKDAYAAQAALPEYAALLREVPEFVATWDDHDFGLNDADATLPFKNASREIFLAVARRARGRTRVDAAAPPRRRRDPARRRPTRRRPPPKASTTREPSPSPAEASTLSRSTCASFGLPTTAPARATSSVRTNGPGSSKSSRRRPTRSSSCRRFSCSRVAAARARTGVASPPRNGVSWTRSPGPRRRSS